MSCCICVVKERQRCSYTIRQTGLHQEACIRRKCCTARHQHAAAECSAVTAGMFVLATVSCGGRLFALFALSTSPPLTSLSPLMDGLLLLRHTATSNVGIQKQPDMMLLTLIVVHCMSMSQQDIGTAQCIYMAGGSPWESAPSSAGP